MFGRKKSSNNAPSLPAAVASAQEDARGQLAISGVRKVVTDHLNKKQFGDIATRQLQGMPLPEPAQARIDRYTAARDATNRYAMLTGLSRVDQHDAEIGGMRKAAEKLTPPDVKAGEVLFEAQTGKSFDKSADAVRKGFEELDKKYPNSYEKWAD
jgi:hypothetical protein